MTTYTISQIESLTARLPIGDSNFGTFEGLLGLTYDLFRPIMDLLFSGAIFPEDLVDTQANTTAGSQLLSDSAAAAQYLAAAGFDVAPAALRARAAAILAAAGTLQEPSSRATGMLIRRDQSAVGAGTGGAPAQSYAPASFTDASYDSSLIAPNEIQLLRGGSLSAAQKIASADFAAAMNPEVT